MFLLSGNSDMSIIFTVCDHVHRVHFLVMKAFSNILRSTFCRTWADSVLIKCLSHFCCIIAEKTLFTLTTSLILSLSIHHFTDIVDEASFGISCTAEFTSTSLYVATDTETASPYVAQLLQYSQNMLKLLAFK